MEFTTQKYFLLVFNTKTGILESKEEFTNRKEGLRKSLSMQAENANEDLEIVLFGARSLEALKQTHGRYFKKEADNA